MSSPPPLIFSHLLIIKTSFLLFLLIFSSHSSTITAATPNNYIITKSNPFADIIGERYAWFTAIGNRTDKYHLTLQAALESVFQCCTDKLYPVVMFDGEFINAPSWLRILHDAKQILVYPYKLSWVEKLTKVQLRIAPSYFRMEIPFIMNHVRSLVPFLNEQYVLYTDTDVIFYQLPEFIKPPLMTIGPEGSKGKKDNNGIMFMNLKALQPFIPAYTSYASSHGDTGDQVLTLFFFRNMSTLLPDNYNWKPYWGLNNETAIIHTHGTKLSICLEHFLFQRYDYWNFFGLKSKCSSAKPYGGLHRHSSILYKVTWEDQMRAYMKYAKDLYTFAWQFDERLLKFTKGKPIAPYPPIPPPPPPDPEEEKKKQLALMGKHKKKKPAVRKLKKE